MSWESKIDDLVKPNVELTERNRGGVVTMLSALLGDQFALGTRMRNCRWNLVDMLSRDLRTLFDSHHKALAEISDGIADRASMLGGSKTAMLARFLKLAQFKEQPGQHPQASQITVELVAGHEAVIDQLLGNLETCAANHGNVDTMNFLGGMMMKHEHMARGLRDVL